MAKIQIQKPKPNKKKKNHNSQSQKAIKITLVTTGVVLVLLCTLCIAYYFFEKKYNNKIYPNIKIGSQDVSGKTYMETLNELDDLKSDFDNSGLVFVYGEKKVTIPTTFIKDESAGISVDILSIDSNASVEQAYQIARLTNTKNNLFKKISLLFKEEIIIPQYTLNEEELINRLQTEFSSFEKPAQNAELSFSSAGEIIVSEEKQGQAFIWSDYIQIIRNNIYSWKNNTINLELKTDYPEVKKADTASLVQETEKLLALAPLTLFHEEEKWEINKTTLQDWLMFSAEGVDLDIENVTLSLKEIANKINQPVKEGKFSLNINEDESITIEQFQEGENGLELKLKKTIKEIKNNWLENNKKKTKIIVEVTEPRATPDNLDNLGIKELLGTGTTNFSGSPYNRIQNIKKGAEILNGLLIAPGEIFSLVTTLGHIDGESGWLPELVIKENKTIPEYGGGLCQIGTTSFRAAMMSGMEIVERRNHSYVVSYYDYNGKPGVDATIYEPKPDFRFKNDTDNYILWRTRIEGYDIYFEFWGTSDGRNGYFTDPVNYNWVSAPETIITEVDTLDPGEMNCTEKAHTGVSASFDYIIERPDDEDFKQTFTSVYKALPAVCDKGREDNTELEPEKTLEEEEGEQENTNTNTNKKKKKKKN